MAPKSKRDEKSSEGEYEFRLPEFDEKAFVRREVEGAKASFWVLGLGTLAGALSAGLFLLPVPWWTGWLPLLAAMLGLRPMLERIGFSEELTKPRALVGNYFMLFFTGLAIWILAINFL